MVIFLIVFYSSPLKAFQDIDYSKVELKIENVRDNIYVIYGPGGNIGVSIGEDGVFLIDDQFAPLTEKIISKVKTISKKEIKFVINTHWHPDHTGSNENFGNMGTIIMAHDNVRTHMAKKEYSKQFNYTSTPSPKIALPILTFSTKASLHLNGDEARMIHIPNSHTDGDTAIYFKNANVIHMGDAFLQQGYPLIDWSFGGTIDGMIKGFQTALDLINDETLIIPGHGPVVNKQKLAQFMDLMKTIRARINDQILLGKTEEEVVAMGLTKEWDDAYTNPYVNGEGITRAIYHTLKAGPDHSHP